ncbi:DUF2975 domain-containing protein [Terrimonas rubra]|uniref:DUF2975 domain-containing protein n=1 Tax=Terrimonas rubra TaxID=1035890 RepID=A0ABW6A412_9BACT
MPIFNLKIDKMMFSKSPVIKFLDRIAGAAFLLALLTLIIKIFFPGPTIAVKPFRVYGINNISISKPTPIKTNDGQDYYQKRQKEQQQEVMVKPDRTATVSLSFKKSEQLFRPAAILFQLAFYSFYILFVLATFQLKMFLGNICRDQIFSLDSVKRLFLTGLFFICIPVIEKIQGYLLIDTINTLQSNDSGYILSNDGISIFSSLTVFGIMMIIFSIIFKVGVSIKNENEDFV